MYYLWKLNSLSFKVRDISMANKTNPLRSLRRQSLKNGNDVSIVKKGSDHYLLIRSERCMKISRAIFLKIACTKKKERKKNR